MSAPPPPTPRLAVGPAGLHSVAGSASLPEEQYLLHVSLKDGSPAAAWPP